MKFNFRHLLWLGMSLFALATSAEPNSTIPEQDTESAQDNRFAQEVMLQALGLIGVNYRWGGSTPESGLDCSGFIRYIFQQSLNIALPHNALAISRLGEDIDKTALKPGDLVFFNTLGRRFSHVGLYLGDDRFIHSPRSGAKIQIVRLSDAYWTKRYNGARRVTSDTVATRSPFLQQLLQQEKASEPSRKGKKASRSSKPSRKANKQSQARKSTKKKR